MSEKRQSPPVRDRFGDWRFTSVVECSTCRWYRDYKRCEVFEEPPEEYWLEKEECPEYEPASLRGDK